MTKKQKFQEVLNLTFHGEWTQAAKLCVEYNLHAKDMVEVFQDMRDDFSCDPCDPLDLAHLAENAAQLRRKDK